MAGGLTDHMYGQSLNGHEGSVDPQMQFQDNVHNMEEDDE